MEDLLGFSPAVPRVYDKPSMRWAVGSRGVCEVGARRLGVLNQEGAGVRDLNSTAHPPRLATQVCGKAWPRSIGVDVDLQQASFPIP